jgi:hypothetical protein
METHKNSTEEIFESILKVALNACECDACKKRRAKEAEELKKEIPEKIKLRFKQDSLRHKLLSEFLVEDNLLELYRDFIELMKKYSTNKVLDIEERDKDAELLYQSLVRFVEENSELIEEFMSISKILDPDDPLKYQAKYNNVKYHKYDVVINFFELFASYLKGIGSAQVTSKNILLLFKEILEFYSFLKGIKNE